MPLLTKIIASLGDIERLINALRYAVQGIRAALQEEAAFRQEVALFFILAPLGAWLGDNGIERILLIGSLFIVMIVELLNSAIEATVDRIGEDRHKLSGRAKDMGSAAVLLSVFLVILTWGLVLFDHLSSG
ncbi:MAG: diacylglycerol kinase [Gammaproteobacteria bacterium]|nr:diacylglycerol kinase [Gammaproteobacteria bacterium]